MPRGYRKDGTKLGFQKGNKNPTFGTKRPQYIKDIISKKKKGKPPWNTGRPHPKKVRDKISKSLKGRFRGAESPHWKNGKTITGGYIVIFNPSHPYCNKLGYIYEHRLVMEKKIGRYLRPEEVVHHINGIRDDNRPENLELFPNNSKHLSKKPHL